MITPEAQTIIDDLKKQLEVERNKVKELEEQIRKAKEVIEDEGQDDIFEGIFN